MTPTYRVIKGRAARRQADDQNGQPVLFLCDSFLVAEAWRLGSGNDAGEDGTCLDSILKRTVSTYHNGIQSAVGAKR
jgi:hypothetical protein